MEIVLLFKVLFTLFLLLLISISNISMPIPDALADSLSFSRHEVGDDERDGINIDGTVGSQTTDDYKDPLDNSTDILKITYLSDAKNLNASLWLGGNFTNDPAVGGAQAMVYGMLLMLILIPRPASKVLIIN